MRDAVSRLSVLFVCTGNICRSPTAEAVFRRHVREAGLEERFVIDSAGTHGYHIGDPPDARSIALALERGVDMRDLRARRVNKGDFEAFDHIFAMDEGHYAILERFAGKKAALSFFLEGGGDVPDPYYGGAEGFARVYDMIDRRCGGLLEEMRKARGF